MAICTPICPICLKNYSKECTPVSLQPCGHGICTICISNLELRDECPNCPVCRTPIEGHAPNFDLKTMCDDVEIDPTYWGRRLVEVIHLPNQTIEISDEIRPFCKLLCYRIAYSDYLNDMSNDTISWSHEDKEKVQKIIKVFSRCIKKNNIEIENAFKWIKVLNFKTAIENYIVNKILNFYEIKEFLEEKNASWIIDALSI